MLFSLIVLAGIGAAGILSNVGNEETYGSKLEEYIVSQNPKDIADVERLTVEFDRKSKEGYL